MKLEYSTIKNEDRFILTNFNCQPSLELLAHKGLFKILWSRQKSTSVHIDGYDIILEKDQVIFCTPLNNMKIQEDTEGLISIVFNKEFFCIQTNDDQVSCNGLLFFGSAQPQIVKLCEKEVNQFSSILSFLEEDFKIKDRLQGEMIRSLLKRMLIISTRMVKEDKVSSHISNAQLDIIRQYNLLVEKHFRKKHQVSEYADLLFKSPKTLSNLFSKYGGKTPLAMIHSRIVLEAKRLLLYSEKTTEEIAYELGYKDAGHFSKFFKKQEGMSPKAFKSAKKQSI
ncbi:MAG: helix-turn-helix domain-containing protein [Saprospiraceae bacterium]|nr:helix-turn-helix domain-containing protein [Saprospiraceae bacterium]